MKTKFLPLVFFISLMIGCSSDADVLLDDVASNDDGMEQNEGPDAGDDSMDSGDGSDAGDDGMDSGDGSDAGDDGMDSGDGSDTGDDGMDSGDGSDAGDAGDDNMDGDDMPSSSPIVGLWTLTDLVIQDGVSSIELTLADVALDLLVADECDVATFDFAADGSLITTTKINNIDLNSTSISCPTESEMIDSMWMLDGDQLTIATEDVDDQTITIQLEGDVLTVSGADVNVVEGQVFEGADLVFERVVM